MSLLEVKDLKVGFRQDGAVTQAVRGVTFSVDRGETVALVGESGSGKSVTALSTVSLLGESAIVEGSVTYDGQQMIGANDKLLRKVRGNDISFIFQEPMTSLNPLHTLEKQLTESIELHQGLRGAAVRERILELLNRVGIRDPESRLGAYPHQLSGGQRQRVMIAMALSNKPDVLIADEPTTALDATLEMQIVTLLRELQEKFGCSVLFVSHHLGTVAELCDEVAVMYAGEVVERGDVAQVFRDPCHPYTQALFECDPARIREATRRLPTIPGTLPDLRRPPAGCAFRARCPKAFERCKTEHPPLYDAGGGQAARCHLNDPAEDRA